MNTIWEGPDNILCLDVARGIERNDAHEPFLERLRDAVSVSDDDDTTRLVSRRIEDLDAAITAWAKLDGPVAEARLFPLARYMGDVYAGALLTEQAAWERETRQSDRKTLVARLYALRYLADVGPLRGIDAESDDADRAFRRARGGRTGDLVSSPSNSESTRHAAIGALRVCSRGLTREAYDAVARRPSESTNRSSASASDVPSTFSMRRTR